MVGLDVEGEFFVQDAAAARACGWDECVGCGERGESGGEGREGRGWGWGCGCVGRGEGEGKGVDFHVHVHGVGGGIVFRAILSFFITITFILIFILPFFLTRLIFPITHPLEILTLTLTRTPTHHRRQYIIRQDNLRAPDLQRISRIHDQILNRNASIRAARRVLFNQDLLREDDALKSVVGDLEIFLVAVLGEEAADLGAVVQADAGGVVQELEDLGYG